MKPIPAWFERELAVVDPAYYVFYNDHYDYFEIKRKMDVSRTIRGAHEAALKRVRAHNPTVAVFRRLNDAAMLELRRRKYLGLKFHRAYRDDAYLEWILDQNRQAKAKKQELSLELMTEGFMELHRLDTRHTVSGGSHDPSGASIGGS